MIRHAGPAIGAALLLAGCAMQPGEANLQDSFTAQIAAVEGVDNLELTDGELTFRGPDGRGGTGDWHVRIESAVLEARDDERVPFEGHIRSTWSLNGTPVDPPMRAMSFLPQEFLDSGIAEVCYALWDADQNAWDW